MHTEGVKETSDTVSPDDAVAPETIAMDEPAHVFVPGFANVIVCGERLETVNV